MEGKTSIRRKEDEEQDEIKLVTKDESLKKN